MIDTGAVLAGTVLAGRYRLEGPIATGGVGTVWRAADQVLDRPVAVKLLRGEFAGSPAWRTRFRAEAHHAGSLSHPGIAQVYDYREADPPYLVMELVDGPSLAEVMSGGPLAPAQVLDIAAQAADALAAAHAAGVVHRDVKPANLLLADGRVKITDFGIASAAGSAALTQADTLIGTPGYLAPERTGGSPATSASDLYSLGVVIYECLAGRPPFPGTPLEVATSHQHLPFPPLPPGVPGPVAALVAELTAKNPGARPASAEEVARRAGQLRDELTGNPTIQFSSPPDFPSTHRPRWPRRTWTGRATVLAVTVAAVLAGLAGWLLARASSTAPDQARPPAASPGPSTAPASAAVPVNAAALTGQPVSAVVRWLRQLGLQPRVRWAHGTQQAPGTVVSVHPAGQVAAGSIVTVTAAFEPPGHRRHNGYGNGQGNNRGN